MAFTRSESSINKKPTLYENQKDLKKLYIFISIVDKGEASKIIDLFNEGGCSAYLVQSGEGTAKHALGDIFGVNDNRKDIIINVIKKKDIEYFSNELKLMYEEKRAKGISFTIPMSSIVGIKAYEFLADAL